VVWGGLRPTLGPQGEHMAKVKITMGYPQAALQQGLVIDAGDVIEVEEVLAHTWITAGWAELVVPKQTTKTETATVKLKDKDR
jgi:hypothetical protein